MRARFRLPAMVAAFAATALPSPRPAGATDVFHSFSPGVTLSISLGDKPAFGLGVDLKYTALIYPKSPCTDRRLGGVGAFAQATWLNFRAARFAAGAHGGPGVTVDAAGFAGELGWTYRTDFDEAHPGGHAIQLGVDVPVRRVGDAFVRGTIPWPGTRARPEITFGGGARVLLPIFFPTTGYACFD